MMLRASTQTMLCPTDTNEKIQVLRLGFFVIPLQKTSEPYCATKTVRIFLLNGTLAPWRCRAQKVIRGLSGFRAMIANEAMYYRCASCLRVKSFSFLISISFCSAILTIYHTFSISVLKSITHLPV